MTSSRWACLRSVSGFLVLMVLLLCHAPGTAGASTAAAPFTTRTYDAHHHSVVLAAAVFERGPPDTIHRGNPCAAVDRRSCGPLGRSGTGDPPTAYTYDADATPAKAATSHGIESHWV